jgi:predicted ABC-type ATPase
MVVVAGPSGSGKSTHFPVAELSIACFNVDDRCAELNGGSYRAIPPHVRQRVQKECEGFIERCTMEGRSFAVETTLRTDVVIRQAEAARAAGFRLEMIFVATDAVGENVSRVARRGLDGGHSAPEPRIREIYDLSLSNLPRAIEVFDEVLVFDSTAFDAVPRLVARYESGVAIMRNLPWPAWCLAALGQPE